MSAPVVSHDALAGVRCMPIPTPFAVGKVNVYLIEDDPLTLIDTGPNSGTSLTRLEAQLAEHGRRIEDLERIVVTHQHIDHIGLTDIVAQRSGAEVVALDVLQPWLGNYGPVMEADDAFAETIMLRHGVPPDVVTALRTVARLIRAWGAAATVTVPLVEGSRLAFAGRAFDVHHRPGHSPTDTVFHDPAAGLLIGGDHLIKHISSNPLIARPPELALDAPTPPRPRALLTYMVSLAATREMDLRLVVAGHGDPIDDHQALIDERMRMHERRASKIAKMIDERPRNAYEIAQDMWGNVAVTQAYLTISEVLGHVDMLLRDGRVVEHRSDGLAVFEAA